MKKQLAFLLAMVMMFSLACVPASAEDIILEEATEETVLEPGGEAAPLPANEESVEPVAEQTGKTVASAADEESVVPEDMPVVEEEDHFNPADELLSGDGKEALKEESIDVSDSVLQAGGWLPDAPEGCLSGGGDSSARLASLKQTIYYGLADWQGSIELEAYRVSADDIGWIFREVINENPDLFYATGFFIYWQNSYGVVTSIEPQYDYSYTNADVEAYRSTVEQILRMMDGSWNDVEKLLFLHDYLITHCEYDLSYQRYNAHDALVVGSAVCQGYALAFADLCRKSGLNAAVISSQAIGHAWNLITVWGENYYVDCTWDDPIGGYYEAYCAHNNFLVSREKLAESHDGTDWTNGSINVYQNVVTSSRYDGAFWQTVRTAIPLIGHTGVYMDYDNASSIIFLDMNSGSFAFRDLPGDGNWPVWGNSYAHWGNWGSVTAKDGMFYFTLPTEVWSLSPGGAMSCVYELTDSERYQGYLYGIVLDGGTLYYQIGTQPNAGSFRRTALRPGTVMGTLVRDSDGIYRVYKNGVFNPVTGFIQYEGALFYVQSGVMDSSVNGLKNDPNNPSIWYFCSGGQVQAQYSGLAEYSGEWFYLSDGVLDTTRTGIVMYDGGQFMIALGRILREANGLVQDPNTGRWYYLAAGQTADYTGLVQYDGAWFYVIDGELAVNYTGWVSYNGSKFYVKNGMLSR